MRQPSGAFGAKGTLLENVGEAEAGICVKRGQIPNQNAAYWIAVAVDFFRSIVYIKSMMSRAKTPDLDACGLFRAVHSHNPAL